MITFSPKIDKFEFWDITSVRILNIGGDPRTFDSTSVEGGQLRSGTGLNDSTEPSITRFFPAASITRSISSSERTDDVIGGGGSREPGIRQSIVIERGSNPTIGRSTTGHSGYSRSNTGGNRDSRGRVGHCKKFTPAELFQKKIPREKHSFYNVDFFKSKIRLFYTPLELNELMHESKSLFEVFLGRFSNGHIWLVKKDWPDFKDSELGHTQIIGLSRSISRGIVRRPWNAWVSQCKRKGT